MDFAMNYHKNVATVSISVEPERYVSYYGRRLNVAPAHIRLTMLDGTLMQRMCQNDYKQTLTTIAEMIEEAL